MKSLILLVGRTASGKDTLASLLRKKYKLKILKSYSTRSQRPGEGETHIFITPEDVSQYKDRMAAYTKIGEYEYFCTEDQLLENDIYIIDPVGVESLRFYIAKKKVPINLIVIGVVCDEAICKRRALQRGDTESQYLIRKSSEMHQFYDFFYAQEYKYLIQNNEGSDELLEKAVSILKKEGIIE